MRKALKTVLCFSVFGSGLVIAGYLSEMVSVTDLVLLLGLFGCTIVLSCAGLKLCERVEMLEGLVYRPALKVGRMQKNG
jgi:hypothetical protein